MELLMMLLLGLSVMLVLRELDHKSDLSGLISKNRKLKEENERRKYL
jgi:hypothetical protein